MADESFRHPRLAALYDVLDTDRGDLVPYLLMAGEFGARSVLDIGCGTGVFALLLADRGLEVVGVDPAGASLDVARGREAPTGCAGSRATPPRFPRCASTSRP